MKLEELLGVRFRRKGHTHGQDLETLLMQACLQVRQYGAPNMIGRDVCSVQRFVIVGIVSRVLFSESIRNQSDARQLVEPTEDDSADDDDSNGDSQGDD